MRAALAAGAGGLFGVGLMVSGMTNPARVQGFLDIFGAWDPTLAFVMGGAILPMGLAWRLARSPKRSALPLAGGTMPAPPSQDLGRDLILGSVLFGIGWGLAGLCPGPALAALGYGGPSVWLFSGAMVLGMLLAPPTRLRVLAAARSG